MNTSYDKMTIKVALDLPKHQDRMYTKLTHDTKDTRSDHTTRILLRIRTHVLHLQIFFIHQRKINRRDGEYFIVHA